MKANELRIGNWVNRFGFPVLTCEELIYNFRKIEHTGKTPIDISAIQLTEEWLLKFGFFMKDDTRYNSQLPYAAYHYLTFNNNVLELECEDSCYTVPLNHIQYVHQLQNLYFALTGKELEII